MKTVFFIHLGEIPLHLKLAIFHVNKFIEKTKIILITDKVRKAHWIFKRESNIYIADIKSYLSEAKVFEEHYVHLSTNSYRFELICFQRWFILQNYCNKNKISEPFLYLDSDVLIYANLFAHISFKDEQEVTLTRNLGPQYSMFKSIESLNRFCSFILMYYAESPKLSFLKNWHQKYFVSTKKNGGVCDMTILQRYNIEYPERCLDLYQKGIYFNNNISQIRLEAKELGYNENKLNLNNFSLKNGKVFLSYIRIAALHFQGDAKNFMLKYYLGKYKKELYFSKYISDSLKPFKQKIYFNYRRVLLKIKYPKGLPEEYNRF